MGEYLTIPLVTDPNEILAGMIADYQTRMPGWVPNDGSPEVTLMRIYALQHAVRLDVDSQVVDSVFRSFGSTIAGVPAYDATVASADSTWTVTDTAGYTIPAGLRVIIAIDGSTGMMFSVAQDVVIPAGSTTAAVSLLASEPGLQGTGLTGPVTLLDPREWVVSVTLNGPTQGGQDAEPDPDYMSRLVRRYRRYTDTIVSATDAQSALLDLPGIGRCQILDNHVPPIPPNPAADGVPGAVTAVVCAADGSNTTTAVKANASAVIQHDRLLSLQTYIVDPVRTNVTVTFSFNVYPGWDPVAVGLAGQAAVTAYLNPAGWGSASTAGGAQDWQDDLVVRYGEIYAALNNVQGLNHVTAVAINGAADTNATLAGPGALPNLTSVVGTYTP